MDKNTPSISVLLAGLEPDFQAAVAAILTARGYDVVQAASRQSASGNLQEKRFDLVVAAGSVEDERLYEFVPEALSARGDALILIVLPEAQASGGLPGNLARKLGVNLVVDDSLLPQELAHKIRVLLRLENKEPPSAALPASRLEGVSEQSAQTLQELQRDYLQKIPGLFQTIGETILKAQSNEDLTELQDAHRLTHALNGTAGSLGFVEICKVAGAMESTLKEIIGHWKIGAIPPGPKPRESVPVSSARISSGRISSGRISSGRITLDGEDMDSRTVIANVLVLDDDPKFISKVESIGRDNLIKIFGVSSPREALEAAALNRIDAGIINCDLAGKVNPFETAQDLRAMEGLGELPLAFISAEASIPVRIEAVHAGASLFLNKPLDPLEFVSAVRRLVPLELETMPRVLVVDDDEAFLQHITRTLEQERFSVETLSDPTRVMEMLPLARPDLLLLDIVMPEISGFDVCRVLRSTEQWSDLPVLFLTIYPSEEVLIKCFEAGGDDYIQKPVLREELLTRLNVRLDKLRLFKERADKDGLTGLPTRRVFIEQLKMRFAEATRHKMPVSLCLLDLDNFKEVNDTYGHLAGDRVLAGFGRLINRRFRAMDVRGRWGGEEFVVAFYGEEAAIAKAIIGRMGDELRKMVFRGDQRGKFRVTFSAGIASFPEAGDSFEDLFKVVDAKLYEAKKAGRDRIEI